MSLAGPSVAASPSLRLRRKIDLMVPPYAHACQRLIDHPRLTDLFPEYLISIHSIIRTTVPLMDAASSVARGLAPPGLDPAEQGARAVSIVASRDLDLPQVVAMAQKARAA